MNAAEMKVLRKEAARSGSSIFWTTIPLHARDAANQRGHRQRKSGKNLSCESQLVRSRGIPNGIGGWFTERKRKAAALSAIRGEASAINDADQAVALMEMLDAIYASRALGREVRIG